MSQNDISNISNIINQINTTLEIYSDYTLFTPNCHIYLESSYDKNIFISILDYIIKCYNKSDYLDGQIEMIKDDMNIKVIIMRNCILRICQTDIYEQYYEKEFDFIRCLKHPNLEHIYEVIKTYKYTYIISKKVIPLLTGMKLNPNLMIDYDNLYNEIVCLISDLKEYNKSHKDVRLDNIGYDPEIDKYILFDFDKFGENNSMNNNSMNNNSIKTDIDILVKSIEWIKLI